MCILISLNIFYCALMFITVKVVHYILEFTILYVMLAILA
jgi:hypothetical protein